MVWLHYKESAVHSLLLGTLGRNILMDFGWHHKKKKIGKFWLATVCCFRTIPKPYLPKSSLCVFLDEKTFDDWKDMKNDSECGIKRTSLEFQPGVMVTWWLQMYCKICIFFSLLFFVQNPVYILHAYKKTSFPVPSVDFLMSFALWIKYMWIQLLSFMSQKFLNSLFIERVPLRAS